MTNDKPLSNERERISGDCRGEHNRSARKDVASQKETAEGGGGQIRQVELGVSGKGRREQKKAGTKPGRQK